jgi:hypothetical protein
VEADEDTDNKVSGSVGMGLDASSVARPRRKTRVAAAKQSATTAAAKATTVKAVEKKKSKRKASSSLAVETPMIPTPQSKEVESEEEEATEELPVVQDRPVRRSLVPQPRGSGNWWRR